MEDILAFLELINNSRTRPNHDNQEKNLIKFSTHI